MTFNNFKTTLPACSVRFLLAVREIVPDSRSRTKTRQEDSGVDVIVFCRGGGSMEIFGALMMSSLLCNLCMHNPDYWRCGP